MKDLKAFLAVYEAGGFSKGSERLKTVQSNVSARVARLERTLRVRLFERHARGVVPTVKAVRLYRGGKRLIAEADKLAKAIRSQ